MLNRSMLVLEEHNADWMYSEIFVMDVFTGATSNLFIRAHKVYMKLNFKKKVS